MVVPFDPLDPLLEPGGVTVAALEPTFTTCQTPPKLLIPSPLAIPAEVSLAKVYRGCPFSVTC